MAVAELIVLKVKVDNTESEFRMSEEEVLAQVRYTNFIPKKLVLTTPYR